ncbi:MAG: helicase C-terminal domain-containing protein [Candidatus Helarchaeota archaeon]
MPDEVSKFFPFESLRPGQALLAKEIYYSVLTRKNVVIEASNGLGKTITSLIALLPIVEKENKKLVYCTRTHTQMERVLEELSRIREIKRWNISGVSLQGRTEMCINPQVLSSTNNTTDAMNLCSTLRKNKTCQYHLKLLNNSKLVAKLQNFAVSAPQIIQLGRKSKICPYFLARALIKNTHVIVTTYNYIIHPAIRNIFLREIEVPLSQCIILFDECHNLHELAMQTASDYISKITIKRAIAEFNNYSFQDREVESILTKLLDLFEQKSYYYSSKYGEEGFPVGKKEIKELLNSTNKKDIRIAESIKNFGKSVRIKRLKAGHPSRSSLFKLGEFLITLIQTINDRKFLHEYSYSKRKKQVMVKYHIKCMDARPLLKELSESRALICLSGTLEPIEAYLDLCGFSRFNTTYKTLPSPFSPHQILILAVQGINTKYFNRTPSNFRIFKDRCLEVIKNTPGNTGIFCASYGVLDGILHAGIYDDIESLSYELFIEQKEISSRKNEEIIQQFKNIGRDGGKAVLLGVCGGRNSEGVDFPGREMCSVVIIGLPFAKPSYSLQALQKYYQEQFSHEKGKEYAYDLPALRKSNQAAGRPVRRLKDMGVIIFLDERFSFPYYKRYLSNWIRENMDVILNKDGVLAQKIHKFYSKGNFDEFSLLKIV